MIELAVPALLLMAALTPQGNTDKKKIKTIFKNTGYGIRTEKGELQTPRFKKKLTIKDGDEEIGTRYLYSIPLGLPATKIADMEKNVGFFSDGLNRPVIVEFRRENPKEEMSPKYLTISVFNKDIPPLYPYEKVPSCVVKNDKDEVVEIPWKIPLGRSLEELVWHNFEHIPHMTVSGMTRFGKTVFLKVLSTYLIEHHPEDVRLVFIDLKGGLEFGRYENLKQVIKVAGDPFEALQILGEIHEEMMGYFKLFRQKYWTNVSDTPIKQRTFVVVDEAAQLAPEKWMPNEMKKALEHCQWILGEITRMGGGLGYREIFCTQYPTADTLPRSVKQNADGKMSFRLPTGYASDVAIDERGAESLRSDIKGRALYKTHELKEMQVPYLSDKEMWERLRGYEIIPNREEAEAVGGDTIIVRRDGVRHEGTNPKEAQPRKRQKRTQNSKRNEGVPSRSSNRKEERVLLKRKGKGVGRIGEGSEMEPPGGTRSDEE